MFWYGILVTCFVGACAAAALAALVPERLAQRVWPGLTWLVPVAVCWPSSPRFCGRII